VLATADISSIGERRVNYYYKSIVFATADIPLIRERRVSGYSFN